ncbi:hypothetical protein C483_16933 [Natrialba hulunbeirensis JCM 10989]|uniref:Uncharacterized protein n=1 Tax=Natrialba hulunbeirensis JCM 10989 TaxID=1227493 RepID=L9ZMM7_9EURY|nr:hypothetical protein [Natrialba hulunbeirensis]ELY87604.1 hypothetical protein C483_16933 [Natrialba hulunbeirensis JCM 10989]
MVGDSTRPPRETDEPQRDRGQVILIGAIALAFIILGIVVVFNGVLYTETISSSATSQSAADAAVTQHELEKGVAGIIHRQNMDGETYGTEQYSGLHKDVVTNSGAMITGIEVEDDSSSDATVATNETDLSVFNGDNISENGEETQIGHLLLEVKELNGEITIEYLGESVTIDSDTVEQEPARIDLVAGTVNGTSNAELQVFDPETAYDSVQIDVDEDVEGGYEIVTNGQGTLDSRFSEDEVPDGSWAIKATVTYDSNDVSVDQTHDIPVYGGEP